MAGNLHSRLYRATALALVLLLVAAIAALADAPSDLSVTIQGTDASDLYTNSTTVAVDVSATHCPPGGDMEALEISFSNDNSTFTVIKADGTAWPTGNCVAGVPPSSPASFNWTLASGADGTRTVYVRFKHGSSVVYASDGITLDTTAPATGGSASVGVSGTNGWYTTAPAITLSATDPGGSGVAKTYFQFVSTGSSAPTNALPGSWTQYASPVTPAEGESDLYAFSVDVATNAETPVKIGSYKVDLSDPAVAITSPANGSSTSAASISVSGTASDAPSGIASVSVNGTAATYDGGTGTFSAASIALACGANTISAVATDNAGRTASSAITVTRTCAPSYSMSYLAPLASSSSGAITTNKIKNGRTVPVKIEINNGSAEYDGTHSAPTISVSGAACGASTSWTVSPDYADAGISNASTNEFRWNNESGGFWVYNLDTKALGLSVGSCYRLDVGVDGSTISTAGWLVIEVTK